MVLEKRVAVAACGVFTNLRLKRSAMPVRLSVVVRGELTQSLQKIRRMGKGPKGRAHHHTAES